jgi:hypothetical protein
MKSPSEIGIEQVEGTVTGSCINTYHPMAEIDGKAYSDEIEA